MAHSVDFLSVNKAFSKQSTHYDTYDVQSPTLQWMRKMVRSHMDNYLKNGKRILELNAGTGLDAIYFVKQKECTVHATDLSNGMIHQMQEKIDREALSDQLTIQQCSYTDLQEVHCGPFDYLFSNFGGLNCARDLNQVTRHFSTLLRPGGYVTFVIMPRICPWELIMLCKGELKLALRRLAKKGTFAHLEGYYFNTYYYSPEEVMIALGKDFKKIDLQGLGCFSPPPHMEGFPLKYPKLYQFLQFLDVKTSRIWPFTKWADHFILTAKYDPL